MASNLELFKSTYAKHLKACHEAKPDDYLWPIEDLPIVLDRMNKAIEKGTFNKEGKAFKLTCKELKIKHTYTAIKEFIEVKANWEIRDWANNLCFGGERFNSFDDGEEFLCVKLGDSYEACRGEYYVQEVKP